MTLISDTAHDGTHGSRRSSRFSLPLVRAFASAALCGVLLGACATTPLHIPTESVRHDEVVLGTVDGSASSVVLFGFITLGESDRFADAYQRALDERRADRLVDVSLYEDSWWAYIVTGRIVHVTATAVQSAQHQALALSATH